MTRYPTHLHFDVSGSAMIRFADPRIALLSIHWAKAGVGQHLLACPDSIDEPGKCLLCKARPGAESLPRVAGMGWDLCKKKWCIFISTQGVFDKIRQTLAEEDLNIEDRDVVLQRVKGDVLVSLGGDSPLPNKKQPFFEDFLDGLASRSYWAKYASPEDLIKAV